MEREATGRAPALDKFGARIADLLQDEILNAGHPQGHLLGSEPELMQRLGVSRSTLREGIRQLEVHGLVRMRRGSGGGLIVSGNPEGVAARALATYLELVDAGLEELFEARKVLEANAAALAADRATDTDIEALRVLLERLSAATPEARNISLHVDLRDLIAHSSGNPALALFIGALNRFTVESIAGQIGRRATAEGFKAAIGPKQRIVEAIVAGDRSEAERATREDLDVRLALLSSFYKSEENTGVASEPEIRTGFEPKLGEAVALRIAHAIASGELAEGTRLGAEPELLTRYQVSRAVFREAIRILELHGFVRTRRGFGGGLVVTRPDPTYAVGTAVSYLRHSPMAFAHLDEVRRMLSIAGAQLAAERADAVGLAELKALYASQVSAKGAAKVEASMAFHQKLGDLSGNRAIGLLLRVLLFINWTPQPKGLAAPLEAELDESHGALLEAVAAHDAALSRRRMIEHVNRAGNWLAVQDAPVHP